jgi:hypothetical protein
MITYSQDGILDTDMDRHQSKLMNNEFKNEALQLNKESNEED